MKVTVCELPDTPEQLERAWSALVAHVGNEDSDLVVLPELAFSPWLSQRRAADAADWSEAVAIHDRWMQRLGELHGAAVVGSRPVELGQVRRNEAFAWEPDSGYRAGHHKHYLPDEEGYWEATWYSPGDTRERPMPLRKALLGIRVCTDMWFLEHARALGQAGIHVLAVPRVTEARTSRKWLIGGQAAAIVSGSFCLSSNRTPDGRTPDFGGLGWIIDPDGEVVGTTSPGEPFLTAEIDLQLAEEAKKTYPRYVYEPPLS